MPHTSTASTGLPQLHRASQKKQKKGGSLFEGDLEQALWRHTGRARADPESPRHLGLPRASSEQ